MIGASTRRPRGNNKVKNGEQCSGMVGAPTNPQTKDKNQINLEAVANT